MIEVERRHDVTVLHMHHGKANALDLEFCRHIQRQFQELASQAGAVVVTGRGSIFSAGVDLLRVLNEGPGYVKELVKTLSRFCEEIFSFPKPLVAAINGHAIAGGCVFACMADRRLMEREGGRIGVPELLVGVPFPAGPLEVMRFAVPTRHLAEVILGGATYEPTMALERGLVDELVDAGALLDRAVQAASELGALAPQAFRLTKAQIRAPAIERMRTGAAELDSAVAEMWAAPGTLAAIREYVAKTFKPSVS